MFPIFSEHIFPIVMNSVYIDPNLYDKKNIIKQVLKNYKKSPIRTNWENIGVVSSSNLHHYYNDWDNENFENPDLSSLLPIYEEIFSTCANAIEFKENVKFNYHWKIENITVFGNKHQFMNEHHHIDEYTLLSAIHYISVEDASQFLQIRNPLQHTHYSYGHRLKIIESLSITNQNSTHFSFLNVKPVEDKMIIFPSFLLHQVVTGNIDVKKPRIAIVMNFRITELSTDK